MRRVALAFHRTTVSSPRSPWLTGVTATPLDTYSPRRFLPHLRPPRVLLKIRGHRLTLL
jgi:hypothetical protein